MVTVGLAATVNVNVVVPARVVASFAVTVTVVVAVVVGVPLIAPEEELMDSPAGRPVADHTYGVVPPDAVIVLERATPTVPVTAPGLLTVGATAVTQLNDVVAVRLAASVAVTVVLDDAAAVGVPVIRPVAALMVKPAGRPVAVQAYGAVPPAAVIACDTGRLTVAC